MCLCASALVLLLVGLTLGCLSLTSGPQRRNTVTVVGGHDISRHLSHCLVRALVVFLPLCVIDCVLWVQRQQQTATTQPNCTDSFFIGSFTTATPSLFFLCGRSSASQTQTHTHTHTDAQKQKHKHQWASACKLCSCWCCWGSCALLQCKHGSMTLGSHSTTRAAQAVSGSLRATTLIERVSTFPHPFPCAKEKNSHTHTDTPHEYINM